MRHPQLLLPAPCQLGDLREATSSLRRVTSQPTACGGLTESLNDVSHPSGKSPELWALGIRCDQNTYKFLLSQTDNNMGREQITWEVVISSVKEDEARMGRASAGDFKQGGQPGTGSYLSQGCQEVRGQAGALLGRGEVFQAEGRASAKPSRQNVAGRCEKWLEQSQEGEAGGASRGDGRGRRKGRREGQAEGPRL